jgi:diguanylate cyclase (GGDEF)-like protein/PAS domain S-box-containing protein
MNLLVEPSTPSKLARLLSRWWPRRRSPLGAARPASTAETQLYRLFEQSDCGLLSCRPDGTVTMCSPVAARLLGAELPSVIGRCIDEWLVAGPQGQALAHGQREIGVRRGDGVIFPAELTVSEAQHGGERLRVLMLRDITDRRQAQERLTFLANFDSLTGLPNRAMFRDRLAQAMDHAQQHGVPMALMFLDLDNFKIVNDSLGHDAGDQLLRHVAAVLRRCLRSSDAVEVRAQADPFTVSRLGGDEFTVIAQDISSAEDAAVVAQRILDALELPVRISDTELHVSASIGISMYPGADVDLDGLIRHTDMAMYRAKLRGKGTYSFFSAEMSAEVAARLALENELRYALDRHEFVLHYQPKVDLASGEITGVEALIRWHCPGRGLVPPDRFIGVLEDSGMILPVGAWALRTACAELAGWDRAGLPPLNMAVNLSARQFRQPYLARFILDTLQDNGIAPQRLELELTESLLLEDNEATRSVLGALASMGVRVAMDDFGTGHSSLSYLKRFDIDTLKIDRSFVSELPHDVEDAAIAAAIVAMGHSLHMKVVAEGVETQGQAKYLASIGCDEIQGYLISRPVDAAQFVRFLRNRYATERDRLRQREYTETSPMTLMSMETLDGIV